MKRAISVHRFLVLGMVLWGASVVLAQQDGIIVAWGRNSIGECDVPAPNANFVAVAAGNSHSLGLSSDGTIVAWGSSRFYDPRNIPAPNANFVAVAGGLYFSLGLKSDGTIVAWGSNGFGQCDVPSPNAGFISIAAGFNHSLGLKSDGRIMAWGSNNSGECNVPAPNTGFIAVSAGSSHSLGLRSNGTIVAWGYNGYGECNVPAPNADFIAVAAGSQHSLGLKANGTIVAWGGSYPNVPTPNEGFVAIAAGLGHSLGLKSDGTIAAWGNNNDGQCNVPAPNQQFVGIAAGWYHSMGIKREDTGITISGAIQDSRDKGIANVVLNGFPRVTISDNEGLYHAHVPPNWQGAIAPIHDVLAFAPPQRLYSPVDQEIFDQDYAGAVGGLIPVDDIQVYEDVFGSPAGSFLNLLVSTEGVVYVPPGVLSFGGGYIQSDNGGVNYYFDDPIPELQIGDRIRIEGYVWADSNNEIYLGQPLIQILGQVAAPQARFATIGRIATDYENVGSFVKTTGRVTFKGTLPDEDLEFVRLEGHGTSVIVYRDPDSDVSFDAMDTGEWWSVQGPCTKKLDSIRLTARFQSDLQPFLAREWHVAGYGDDANPGSEALPFLTIQRGILAATDGDVVLLGDGTYRGEGNRDIDFMGKNIRVCSQSGNRDACVVDAQGTVAAPRVGFKFTGGETREAVLEGVTVTGGYPAGITCLVPNSQIATSPTVRNVALANNPGIGLSLSVTSPTSWMAASTPRIVATSVHDNAGVGLRLANFDGASIDSCEVYDNDSIGIELVQATGPTSIIDTRIMNNGDHGIRSRNDGTEARTVIQRCQVLANGGWGIASAGEDAHLRIDGVVIEGNTLGGVESLTRDHVLEMVDSDIRHNRGPGIRVYAFAWWVAISDCRIVGNDGHGIDGAFTLLETASDDLGRPEKAFSGDIADCFISENGGTGIRVSAVTDFAIARTLVTRNHEGGMFLGNLNHGNFQMQALTVVDNIGDGITCDAFDRRCAINSSIITGNSGRSVAPALIDSVAIACSDFYDNDGGDWDGDLAPYAAVDGNISVDPLFCDGATGNYTLASSSPCAAGNHPTGADCGQIGAFGVGCEVVAPPLLAHLEPLPVRSAFIACDDTISIAFRYVPGRTSPPLRGYSVRVTVDGPVTFGQSDITVQTQPAGAQVFSQVYENAPNDCTVDYTILGAGTVGITTAEGLFTVAFHGASDGLAGVHITQVDFRNLQNQSFPVEHGATAAIRVDCGPPEPVTAVTSQPGNQTVVLGWTDPTDADLATVKVLRGMWRDQAGSSAYPLYGRAPGNTIPARPASLQAALASGVWTQVAELAPGVTSFSDNIAPRGIYFYEIFAIDAVGNASSHSATTAEATNYWLGDVATSGGDGYVNIFDMSALGDSYGVSSGHPSFSALADVGPTDNASGTGVPQPDGLVAFDDLMIFGQNFGEVAPAKSEPRHSGDLMLVWQQEGEREWSCRLARPCTDLKGLRVTADVPHGVGITVAAGSLLGQQAGPVFLQNGGGTLDIGMCLLGNGLGFEGEGELFRVELTEEADLSGATFEARSVANKLIEMAVATEVADTVPKTFVAGPIFPNPFNASTTVQFALPEPQRTDVTIYSLDGRQVRTLLSQDMPAGRHSVQWDGTDDRGGTVASGTYFCRIVAGPYRATQKMVLAK